MLEERVVKGVRKQGLVAGIILQIGSVSVQVVLTFVFNSAVLAGTGKALIYYGGEGLTFDRVLAYEIGPGDPNFVINEKKVQLTGLWLAKGKVYRVELPAGIVRNPAADSAFFETAFKTLEYDEDTSPPVFVAADPFMQAVGSEGTKHDASDYVKSFGYKVTPATRYVYIAFNEPVTLTSGPASIEVGIFIHVRFQQESSLITTM